MSLKPEEIDHISLVNWFHHNFPELADDFHHFANERFLDVKNNPEQWNTGRKLQRMEVKKNVSDFFLAFPQNGFAGLWIELKVGKNKPTQGQIDFSDRKTRRGYQCAIVWGFEAAKEVLNTYLKDYINQNSFS